MKEKTHQCVQLMVTGQNQTSHVKVTTSFPSLFSRSCFPSFIISVIFILVEVDCGVPPPIPHSVMLWDNVSTVGSQVVYQCESGYHNVGDVNVAVCATSGEWATASLLCQGEKPPRCSHLIDHNHHHHELPVTCSDLLCFCCRNQLSRACFQTSC